MIIDIVSAAYRKQLFERVVLGITKRYRGLPPLRTGDRCQVTAPDTYEHSVQMITIITEWTSTFHYYSTDDAVFINIFFPKGFNSMIITGSCQGTLVPII